MIQPRFLDVAPATFDTMAVKEANALLEREPGRHNLGACNRSFSQRAYAFYVDEVPVSVAISASVVGSPVAGFRRQEVVELARLWSAPGYSWATRIMLRAWREVFAPRWPDWPVKAAVSYSQNAHHKGSVYRLDGWEKVKEDCGSSGGGAWSTKRDDDHPALGSKTLWVWRYPLEARKSHE